MTAVWIVLAVIGVVALSAAVGFGFAKMIGVNHTESHIEQGVVPLLDDPDPADEADAPQPVDPQNPPYYQRYNPDAYDPSRAPHCSCHGRPVAKGDTVLLWPIPGHPEGGIDIWCEATYGGIPHDHA